MADPAEISDVRERMRKLFESQSFADVTFYPEGNRRLSLSAHRAILAISSPLFKKLLFDDQKKAGKLEIEINNISFDAFSSIVKYIYTDEVSFDNEALAEGIFEGAKLFNIHSLVDRCKEYFENVQLTCDNVCSKLQMSVENKITFLKERCIEFIENNTFYVLQSPDFEKCNSATMRTICKLQSFKLRSEFELLEAVMQWFRAQPSHERKSLLESLLKYFRFLNLTVGEMGKTLKKYPEIMTADEGLSIMLFLTDSSKNRNFTSLPSWCNKNIDSRCFYKEDVHGSQIELDDADDKLIGKVISPLQPDHEQGTVKELTSLLQMKCIKGNHILKAIQLTFQKPVSEKSRIKNILIKVHVHPSNFDYTKKVENVNSESVHVKFNKIIKMRPGDTVDIEAEAKNIELYKFLQIDETRLMPANPHFNISFSSLPNIRKLYFISKVEYGPQGKIPDKKFLPIFLSNAANLQERN